MITISVQIALSFLQKLSLSYNNIDAEGAIQVIAALKDCKKLTIVTLNRYPDDYYPMAYDSMSPVFHLCELVPQEDTATVESLVAAVRLHRRDADIFFACVSGIRSYNKKMEDIELFMCHGTQNSLRTTLRIHQHCAQVVQYPLITH